MNIFYVEKIRTVLLYHLTLYPRLFHSRNVYELYKIKLSNRYYFVIFNVHPKRYFEDLAFISKFNFK